MMRSVCVYCGSSPGSRPEYVGAAESMGRELARRGIRLVYGGGNVGTMGALARSALAAGGEAVGVIPRKLYERVPHVELTSLVVTEDMHERKARMAELSDAFVALPGGIGTFEELFEAWAWRQIGYHSKPVGLLEVEGFYAPLVSFLGAVSDEGFLKRSYLDDLVVDTDCGRLLDRLGNAPPLKEHKQAERGTE